MSDISMIEIAELANIPRSSLYHQFSSVSDVYRALAFDLTSRGWDEIIDYVQEHDIHDPVAVFDVALDMSQDRINRDDLYKKTMLGEDTRFHILDWYDKYGRLSSERFHSVTDLLGGFSNLISNDPFYSINLMLTTMFSAEVRATGRLSDSSVSHMKRIVRTYFATVSRTAHPVSATDEARQRLEDRWDDAALKLRRADTRLLEFATAHAEGLLGLETDPPAAAAPPAAKPARRRSGRATG